jgi:hypothetical protein
MRSGMAHSASANAAVVKGCPSHRYITIRRLGGRGNRRDRRKGGGAVTPLPLLNGDIRDSISLRLLSVRTDPLVKVPQPLTCAKRLKCLLDAGAPCCRKDCAPEPLRGSIRRLQKRREVL